MASTEVHLVALGGKINDILACFAACYQFKSEQCSALYIHSVLRVRHARHWAAEFTIGAGYVHTKYDTYYNIPNGTRFEKGIAYNYWGLTKVGIGLVCRFGK